jgi:15-cis-phytoene synthase
MQENLKLPETRASPLGAGDLRDSERSCGQMARTHAKNFYWGFISLPQSQRTAIYALYDFARQVDDDADEHAGPDLQARLQHHRDRVRACMRGEYADPVMQVLAHAVRRYGIPESELAELIDGVETDLRCSRYANWGELRQYCRLVASVVGRMCVRIFGYADAVALDYAEDLGLALQLTNILRDVREDAGRDRIYLPTDELSRFGLRDEDLISGKAGAGWPDLVQFEAQRASSLYASGLRVLDYIPRRSAVCVATMAGIYQRILNKIEADPWLPLRGRASLNHVEKLHVVVESWLQAM